MSGLFLPPVMGEERSYAEGTGKMTKDSEPKQECSRNCSEYERSG